MYVCMFRIKQQRVCSYITCHFSWTKAPYQTNQINGRMINCGNHSFVSHATRLTLEHFDAPVAHWFVCMCPPSLKLVYVHTYTLYRLVIASLHATVYNFNFSASMKIQIVINAGAYVRMDLWTVGYTHCGFVTYKHTHCLQKL